MQISNSKRYEAVKIYRIQIYIYISDTSTELSENCHRNPAESIFFSHGERNSTNCLRVEPTEFSRKRLNWNHI